MPDSALRIPHSEGLTYRYPVERLWSGGSYGNMGCFARTDRLSNLDGFWHAGTNDWLCGRLDLHLEANGKPLNPDETNFNPGHQATTFTGDGFRAEKLVFVPYGAAADGGEESSFYTVLKLQATERVEVRVTCDVRWPATASTTHTKQPERHHIQRRVHQWMEGSTLLAQTAPFRVDRWNTVLGEAGPADKTAPTEALQPYWKHLGEYIVQYDRQAAAKPAG